MILTSIKVFSLNIKKYNNITIIILSFVLLATILTIILAQPHLLSRMLNPDLELSYMQDKIINAKMIGNSENVVDEDYYYMNFSNYSFVYLVEKYGKVLGIAIISLLAMLSIKIILNYKIIKDEYGKLLIIGLGLFIFIQSLVSFFTLLGIVNISTVDMPFITHDNVSIIIYMMSVSLLLSIYGQKNICSIKNIETYNNV